MNYTIFKQFNQNQKNPPKRGLFMYGLIAETELNGDVARRCYHLL